MNRTNLAFRPLLTGLAVLFTFSLLLLCLQKQLFDLEVHTLTIRQLNFDYPPRNRTVESGISLVSFDKKTRGSNEFNQLFGTRIPSRSAYAYVVRFFKRTQPKLVYFDLNFNFGTNYDDPAGDRDLVDSLAGTTAFAAALTFNHSRNASQSFAALKPDIRSNLEKNTIQVTGLSHFPHIYLFSRFPSLIPAYTDLVTQSPMRYFSAQQSVAKADISRIRTYKQFLKIVESEKSRGDTSKISRRWVPFTFYDRLVFPTISLGMLLQGEKKVTLSPDGLLRWNGGQLHLGTDGYPLIKWHHHGILQNYPVYPEVSLWDVILSEIRMECAENSTKAVCQKPWSQGAPTLSPERFRDRYVIIGYTLKKDLIDLHNSIYNEPYPGPYIVANTLDNALHDNFVLPAPGWGNTVAFLLMPILTAASILYFRSVWINLLLLFTLGYGYYIVCFIAYRDWNQWLYLTYPLEAMVMCFIGIYLYRYISEQKKRQQLRFAFGKYVSPGVMQLIERNPDKLTLGGERREMTFLFCDIRGFTRFSDHNPPEAVQAMLTQYFSLMNRIILHEYHGSINKLIGDAIMAYWGFPLENEDHAYLAVSAAIRMREAIHEWRQNPEHPPIDIGIGINTGEAMIGNVGSEDFMDFTVIGDAVNVASRLESANKDYGTNIIISAATYEKVKDRISARSLGWTNIRGKAVQVEVFEPVSHLKGRA